jgi:hypothetical protein
MVAFRPEKDLRFVFETAERLGVGNTVNISLEAGANSALLFFNPAAAARICKNAIGTNQNMLQFFPIFSGTGHFTPSFR